MPTTGIVLYSSAIVPTLACSSVSKCCSQLLGRKAPGGKTESRAIDSRNAPQIVLKIACFEADAIYRDSDRCISMRNSAQV